MKILFVCIGNICRSPVLHHLMKRRIELEGIKEEIEVDSCGISGWHLGEDMDERMLKEARSRGLVFGPHRAKVFKKSFYKKYDYIFVVTKELYNHLRKSVSKEEAKKILLATHFSISHKGKEVPDPYYGNQKDFARVFSMIETLIDETFQELRKQL